MIAGFRAVIPDQIGLSGGMGRTQAVSDREGIEIGQVGGLGEALRIFAVVEQEQSPSALFLIVWLGTIEVAIRPGHSVLPS